MPFKPSAHPGILHHYAKRLVAFEHAPVPKRATSFLLFIGGMGDDLFTVRYPAVLARHSALPASWAVAEVTLTSSGTGWLSSSLQSDADELALAVGYFRAHAAETDPTVPCQIMLVGHSTGSQDVASYLIGPWKAPTIPEAVLARPKVDGVVLQAGISDREGMVPYMGMIKDGAGQPIMDPATGAPKTDMALGQKRLDESVRVAAAMIQAGKGAHPMPPDATGEEGQQPIAERWYSTRAKDGDDDLFSTTNPASRDERVFGAGGIASRKVPLQVLVGGKDEHMLEETDREALVAKWEGVVKRAGGVWDPDSGVVPDATHNLNGAPESAVEDLCARILGFVSRTTARASGKL